LKISKVIILFILLIAQGPVFAENNAKKEAEILLNTMGMETAFEESISRILNIQLQQNPSLKPYKQVMLDFFSKHMSFQSLKPDMINIYADAFTTLELREISAFYRTPTGSKTIKLMPELMAKGSQLASKRVQDNTQELQKMISDKAEQLKTQ